MTKRMLDFTLTRKQLLNSNDSSKGNWRVKMGVVKYLRELSCEKGKALAIKENAEIFYDHLKVTTVVMPPTRRRIDPPNLAPTTKAIIDGLTDAGWWEDDNFSHVLDSSFRYGGLSGIKDKFRILIFIEEVPEEDVENYVLESEISDKYPAYIEENFEKTI